MVKLAIDVGISIHQALNCTCIHQNLRRRCVVFLWLHGFL